MKKFLRILAMIIFSPVIIFMFLMAFSMKCMVFAVSGEWTPIEW